MKSFTKMRLIQQISLIVTYESYIKQNESRLQASKEDMLYLKKTGFFDVRLAYS